MRQALAFWSARSRNARLALVALLCLAVIGAGVVVAPRLAHASGPTISGFSPASGPLRTIVTVNGSGLLVASGVTIGGVSASFRIHNNSWLDVRVPDTAQTGAIVVTTTGGIATSATDFTVSPGLLLNPQPTQPLSGVQRITRMTAVTQPGGSVLAQGSGFTPGETVAFTLGATSIGSTIADGAGAFAGVTLAIPSNTTPSLTQVSATGQTSAGVAQAALRVSTYWSQAGFSAAHSGMNPSETTLGTSNVNTLAVKWQAPLTLGVAEGSQPAVADGNVYLTTQPCGLTALSIEGGNQQWQVNLCPSKPEQDGLSFVAPTVANGKVYLPALQAVWAFDDQTGAQLWKTDLPLVGGHNWYSYVTYADSKIFAISDQGVWALDADTGAIMWTAHPGITGPSGTAVANGRVYALGDHVAVALDENTGATVWSVPTSGIQYGPVYANGKLYAAREDVTGSFLFALDATNGATLWSQQIAGNLYTAPAVAGNLVYQSTASVDLTAYDATTGKPQWSSVTRFLGPWQGITAIANGVAYIVSSSTTENTQKLYALNAVTGATLWSYTLPQYETAAGASVAISDGTIYVESAVHNGSSYTSSLFALAPSGSMIAKGRGIHTRARS